MKAIKHLLIAGFLMFQAQGTVYNLPSGTPNGQTCFTVAGGKFCAPDRVKRQAGEKIAVTMTFDNIDDIVSVPTNSRLKKYDDMYQVHWIVIQD